MLYYTRMKKLLPTKKRIILGCMVLFLAALVFVFATHFWYSVNQGRFVGNPFETIDAPTDDAIFEIFANGEFCWEFAFWSAMMSEFAYAKEGYSDYNAALAALGFDPVRVHTYFTHRGEELDDLMVDAGARILELDDREYTLVALVFRGAIPLEMSSPTTRQNFRRSLNFLSTSWRDIGRVHQGFYSQYNDFLSYILPEIERELGIHKLNYPTSQRKVWIVGYSMGGAHAELLTIDLVAGGVPAENIMTIGFATPNIANRAMQRHGYEIGASSRIFRVMHRRDIVAHLGIYGLWGRTLTADGNTIVFGERGLFTINHHSIPRIYLPYIISHLPGPLRSQAQTALVVDDM